MTAHAPLRLADLTWPEVEEIAPESVLAIPVGATEQHGPHLPFTVDTEIAVALCEQLARTRPQTVVAPAIAYGSSGEHAGFPGTLSIGQEATEALLVELVRSADAFAGVVLVCAHGGNAIPVRKAVARLQREGRNVLAWAPRGAADDSHAGHTETSAMLTLRPGSVRTHRAQLGNTASLDQLIDQLRDEGVRAVSPSGVLGDPTDASAERGEHVLQAWASQLTDEVENTWPA
jgi:mycofactocin precursor peptide peptidase